MSAGLRKGQQDPTFGGHIGWCVNLNSLLGCEQGPQLSPELLDVAEGQGQWRGKAGPEIALGWPDVALKPVYLH